MWPLLFLSILSLGTILERLAFWASVTLKEKELVNRVLEAARYDWRVAHEIARQASKQPVGRFLYAPLRLQNPDPEVFKLALEAAADNELTSMRRGEKVLEAVIALAPLLGLLGTVLGLIKSLSSITLGDIGTDASRGVTTGIGEALITTATGLIIAIFTAAFYRMFQGFLFSQIKTFRKCGNELELLYRQYWPYAPKTLPKPSEADADTPAETPPYPSELEPNRQDSGINGPSPTLPPPEAQTQLPEDQAPPPNIGPSTTIQ